MNRKHPVKELNIRRRFYSESDLTVQAIRYAEKHTRVLGDVQQAILRAFTCLYAPLGMQEFGNPEDSDEALQLALESIAFLESRAEYLRIAFGLTRHGETSLSRFRASSPEVTKIPDAKNPEERSLNSNETDETDFNPSQQAIALDMFNNFQK